jgi:hypothetical protein
MKHASFVVVPALCLAVVLSAYAPVSADGIKSQWKKRLPIGASTDAMVSGAVVADTTASPQADTVLQMMVRRNARAALRRQKQYAESYAPRPEASLPQITSAPSKPLTDTERARMVVKNYKLAVAACAGLHTHERSVCMYHAQLKRSPNQ